MHILMLTHHPPYPPISGGRVRAYEFLRRLARNHDITLLYFSRPEDDNHETSLHLGKFCRRIEAIPSNTFGIFRDRQSTIFDPYWPNSCRPFVSLAAIKAVSHALERESFDLIHCVGYFIAQILTKNLNIPVFLSEDNVEYVCAWRRFTNAQTCRQKVLALFDFLKEKRLEISTWRSVDACIVTSEPEQSLVALSVSTQVEIIPNGVDTNYFDNQKISTKLCPHSMGMLANFRYQPNMDSFLYFRRYILPKLSASYSGRILLIGNAGPEIIAEAGNDPHFTITGQIPDVRPYLASVDVIICPLRLGGGTKIKILESLAMRRAVISTSIGAEGFSVTDGRELLIADSALGFANAVRHTMSNPKLRMQLGINGRSFVSSNHDWDVSAGAIESLYQRLVLHGNAPS
jgi:glycosyltransferase involved in cell wall biosynthesis